LLVILLNLTKEDLFSFLNELAGDEELQQTLRETTSVQALVQVGLSRGYRFSETDLINHFAETLIRPNDDLASFLKKVAEDKELQEKLRPITTAEGIVAVAYQLGFHFSAPDLIRHFAETLLHADDAQAVILFDALGWHFGSLLWALKLTG
jgi:predicted ribosomally synthesized peptide with nif11-like leader